MSFTLLLLLAAAVEIPPARAVARPAGLAQRLELPGAAELQRAARDAALRLSTAAKSIAGDAAPTCTMRSVRPDADVDQAMVRGSDAPVDTRMVKPARCRPEPSGAGARVLDQ